MKVGWRPPAASEEARWRETARRAATLDERLAAPLQAVAPPSRGDRRRAIERLRRWRQRAAQGGRQAFRTRLAWLRVDAARLLSLLADGETAADAGLAGWTAILREAALQARASPPPAAAPPAPPGDASLPFEDLLAPLVDAARLRLLAQLEPAARELAGEPVRHAGERQLMAALAELAQDALMKEFSSFRPAGHSLLNSLLGHAAANASRRHYLTFVAEHRRQGLLGIWQRYPALARAAATQAELWVEATASFLDHLACDLPAIAATFGEPVGTMLRLRAVETGWSDAHRGSRTVCGVAFESGLRVVYKPRSLAPEAAYARLLTWLEREGAPLALTAPHTLDCGDHGWMEHVEARPCGERGGLDRYYARTGAQLCLLYLLGASDLHHDNVIACGEQPVVVDLETLLQPDGGLEASAADQRSGAGPLDERFWGSVLRTGFLPRWELGADGRTAFDLSALGGGAAQGTAWPSREWQAVNSDAMHCTRLPSVIPVGRSTPTFEGRPASSADYLEAVLAGFEATYHFLLRRRRELAAPGGPLDGFRGCRARVLLRPTAVYYGVLDLMRSPAALAGGLERDLELEALARALLSEPVRGAQEILEAERAALARGDIPCFWAPSDGVDLLLEGGRTIPRCYRRSGLDGVAARLAELSEGDLAQQLGLIRGAFHASVARAADGRGDVRETRRRGDGGAGFADLAVGWACRIADDLAASAWRAPAGGAGWIGFAYLAGAARYQLTPLGASLYDGNAGIALFLAALAAMTGKRAWGDLARSALEPVRQALRPERGRAAPRLEVAGIGGLAGLGSVVYGLSRTSRLLGDRSWLDDAGRAVAGIDRRAIAADRQLDVVSGAAGALLGLLAFAEETGEAAALDAAVACGEHLLAWRHGAPGRARAWRAADEEQPLTGFSHGAAGIAYSLARLFAVTGRPAFRDAALEGVAYEDQLFAPQAGNWPDLRRTSAPNAERSFGVSWCHGAPGIGLARLGCLGPLGDEALREDIERALHDVRTTGLVDVDQICCGNFGRLETLLVAAETLGRPDLLEEARGLAAEALARAEHQGSFKLFANLPRHVATPGLFQGTAGIGYQLLRLAFPERLPSVLLLA